MKKWTVKRIDDFGKVITGKTPSSEKPDEFGDVYPFITPSDIPETQRQIITERFLSEKGREAHNRIILPSKSICVVCIGATIGKACMTSRPSFSNQQINSIVPFKGKHDPNFVYYLATTLKNALINFAGGSATPIINKSVFSGLKILAPDYKEQQNIAAVLSAYDDLIENYKRRIALLEKMAEEIYREWFVRLRFPGHEKVKVVKGVPEGWEKVSLEKAFIYTGGGTPSKDVDRYWINGDVNWYTPSDITAAQGVFLSQSGDQCTEEGLNNSSAKMFPAYSVMMTSRATIGAIGINTTPACTNQGFITCIPNERYPLTFLYHWLKLSKQHFELLSGGATFAELTKGTFKRIEIVTPPIHLVEKYETMVRPMFDQMELLLKQAHGLSGARDMLLPRLISGKLSVEKLDIQFPLSMSKQEFEVL